MTNRDPHAFDHIRRYYWHRCTFHPRRSSRERIFRIYWRYMLMCYEKPGIIQTQADGDSRIGLASMSQYVTIPK